MDSNTGQVLNTVAENSGSDLLSFFVVLAVVGILIAIPIYTIILKDRKQKNQYELKRQEQEISREKYLIEIISANTSVLNELKVLLNTDLRETTAELKAMSMKLGDINTTLIRHEVLLQPFLVANNMTIPRKGEENDGK
ncbi:MAG: hypothetical protein LBR74_04735 [Eubacterium sp.]|jgi:hypothetical protein|nr:hypothetical protein [Eubacterium sp.]